MVANAKMAAQLKDIESTILKLLSESSGNILDDEALINTLDDSKKISKKTEESVKGAEATSAEAEAQKAAAPV